MLAASLFLASSATFSWADVLVLKSGQTLEGRVLEETDDSVKFQDMSRIVLTLPKANIERIERQQNALDITEQAREAFANKDHAKAIELAELAVSLGSEDKQMAVIIAESQEALDRADLGEYAEPVIAYERAVNDGNFDDAEFRMQDLLSELQEGNDLRERVIRDLGNLHLLRAKEFLDETRREQARVELVKALEYDETNAEACIALADLYADLSSTRAEARDLYIRALRVAGQNMSREQKLETELKLADIYDQLGDRPNAARFYDRVYRQEPTLRPTLEDELIVALTSLAKEIEGDRPAMAVSVLDRAIQIRDTDDRIRSALAHNLLASQNYERSIEEYKVLLEKQPRFRLANYRIAQAYEESGDLPQAVDFMKLETEYFPDNFDAQLHLGDIYVSMAQYDDARDQFTLANEVRAQDPRALIALAKVERFLGNYSEARENLTEILRTEPDNPDTLLEMGLLNKEEKKFKEALELINRTIELTEELQLEEDSPELRKTLADSYLAIGEINLLERGPGTATKNFEKALEIIPDYPEAYFRQGAAYEKRYASSKQLEDLQEAADQMLLARELDGENPDYAFGLGVLYQTVLATEDTDNQADYFEKAIEQYTDYIALGGGQVTRVQGLIDEIQANLNQIREKQAAMPKTRGLDDEALVEGDGESEGSDDAEEGDASSDSEAAEDSE